MLNNLARAVEYRQGGSTLEKTATTFKIGESTLKEWVKRYKESGEIKNKPLNRTHKKIDPKELECFDTWPARISTSFCLRVPRINSLVRSAILPASTGFLYFVIHTM